MAQKQEKTRVAIYVRVSTLYQVDKDSLPMQRQDLIAYAKLMLGTDDYVIFEDAGYSGKNMDRPKFQEMMTQIRKGLFTHLLVWKIDRISRNLLDFAGMYSELKDLGVIFVSKNEQFDTSTAMGEAMLKIILVFAELERNMTSERVTATMISRASNGLWNGGRVPYGYDYDPDTMTFSIHEAESQVVRLIHDKYEELRSLVRLARMLNEKGYRSRAGNDWSPISLRIILRNIFYCGDYRYNVLKEGNRQKVKDESEWVIVRDHHVPIIEREQKERIIATLKANSKLRKTRTHAGKHPHIFGGLVFCGNCGKMMSSTPSNLKADGWRYTKYLCPTKRKSDIFCTGKSTSDSVLGEFVFNFVLNMLNAQRGFGQIRSPAELQAALLTGNAFSHIESIEPDGLNDLYNVLSSGPISGEVFGSSVQLKEKPKADSELSNLRAEKQRLERALLPHPIASSLYSSFTTSKVCSIMSKLQHNGKDCISLKLLIVRHGDPIYEDDALTEKGWKEAEYLSERLVKLDVKSFYVSPLRRAKETASLTLQKLGRTAEECLWLREFHAPIERPDAPGRKSITWDWLPQDWMGEENFFLPGRWHEHPILQAGNVKAEYDWIVENFDALLERHGYKRSGPCYRAVEPNNDTIVFFCHFALECVLLSHLLNVSPMVLWHGICAAPTSVTTVITEERRKGIASFRICAFGDTSHLYIHDEPPAFSGRFSECYDNEGERLD